MSTAVTMSILNPFKSRKCTGGRIHFKRLQLIKILLNILINKTSMYPLNY